MQLHLFTTTTRGKGSRCRIASTAGFVVSHLTRHLTRWKTMLSWDSAKHVKYAPVFKHMDSNGMGRIPNRCKPQIEI
jgi:hypothetical protein